MADSKISQLPPITGDNLLDSDELIIARAGTFENFAVTRAEMFQSTPAITTSELTTDTATVQGDITVTGTVDGRDVAADGSKLDGIEADADVTDTANVTAAGALMDSEVTNLAAVKALNQGVSTTDSPTFADVTADSLTGSAVTQSSTDTTAGRLLKVGDGGFLSDEPLVAPNDDLNDITIPGVYQGEGVTANRPNGVGNWIVRHYRRTDGTYAQMAISRRSTAYPGFVFTRSFDSGAWSPWVEHYHSGNLEITQSATDATAGRVTKVGDFGLGETSDPPELDDWDRTDWPSGIYKVGTSPLGDHPGGAGTAIISRWNNTQQTQLYIQHYPGSKRGQVWTRVYQSFEWTTWRKSYDSGNAVGTIADGALIEEGETSNGYYYRYKGGMQVCVLRSVQFPYSASFRLRFDWDFPAPFSEVPIPHAVMNYPASLSNMTPSVTEIGPMVWENSGANANTARLSIFRNEGMTDFQPGDYAVYRLTAIGRYE